LLSHLFEKCFIITGCILSRSDDDDIPVYMCYCYPHHRRGLCFFVVCTFVSKS